MKIGTSLESGFRGTLLHSLAAARFLRQSRFSSLRRSLVPRASLIGHFLWAQKGTLFIEVFRYEWQSDWQALILKETWKAGLAYSTGVQYAKIECSHVSCSQGMSGLNADVSLNRTKLGNILMHL